MELRQLKYFLKTVECGSLGKAALELNIGTSALSQQLTKLENELSIRLLSRTSTGALPTSAGIAFMHHAQLAIRQTEQAVIAAHKERTSGYVSIGLPPTIANVLALPLIQVMNERYPHIQLHIVETLSGHLTNMLNARQLDLAFVFNTDNANRWSVRSLLDEELFLIYAPSFLPVQYPSSVRINDLSDIALIMPSGLHGLRISLVAAFERFGVQPSIVMEIDGLAVLMEAVLKGYGATIQPGAAIARINNADVRICKIDDKGVIRRNHLVSLPDDDLSPSALATRVVITSVARQLVESGAWPGARWIG